MGGGQWSTLLIVSHLALFAHLFLQGCNIGCEELRLVQQESGGPVTCDREPFVINGTQYLAAASCPGPFSLIQKWDGTSFSETQRLNIGFAFAVRYFEIGSTPYLVFIRVQDDTSPIYRWNGVEFVEFQYLATARGASALVDFVIDGVTYIAVANTAHAVSVYTWNGTAFDDFQVFRTNYDPRAVAYFEVDGEKCLGIACHEGGGIQIHRWSGTSFGLWQELDALWAVDLVAFHISGVFYLAVAEHTENTRIYTKSGSDFVVLQTLPLTYAHGCHAFVASGVQYLAMATTTDDSNTVYGWTGSSFEPKFCTPGASANDWFSFGETDSRLLLSRSHDGPQIFEIPDAS